MQKKTTQLKNLINSNKLEFIMEAHNGLSAKICEETGFDGIWGSGLSISAALGVRDNNEASWTQVLEVLEFMSDATRIPILLDGDTGYGNFNNMRRLVKKLEQRDVAGVCIEDKLFPKTNSFIGGEKQPLADVDEFCGKLKAAKDTQADKDFVVVARVESLIAGWGVGEALRRAEEYRKAGADAILMHSKRADVSEIEAFMKEWAGRHPVIIVPTKYYSTPTDKFRDLGVSLVIWANHNLRSAISAMKETSKQIFKDQSLINVEEKVVTVNEVFRLQGAGELEEAEDKYLPTAGKSMSAVILAATQGEKFGELTQTSPKTLIEVRGKSLLASQIESLNQVGVKNITVVRGFAKNKIAFPNLNYVDNDEHTATKELYSLYLAKDKIAENAVISYGDILYQNYILNDLLGDDNDVTVVVDVDCPKDAAASGEYRDYVATDKPYSRKNLFEAVALRGMNTKTPPAEISGEFIGLWKVGRDGSKHVKSALENLSKRPDFKNLRMADLFNELVGQKVRVAVKYIHGSWLDVDSIVDLHRAGGLGA